MAVKYTLQSSALPDSTQVVRFRGVEGVSSLYRFIVDFAVPTRDSFFKLSEVVGKQGTLELDFDDGEAPTAISGIFARVVRLGFLSEHTLCRVVLVPRLWLLTQDRHSRVFTDRSVPQILEAVLGEAGFTADQFALKLVGTYAPRKHVCQYEESGFAFMSRWMEREGMCFFFQKEKLIIVDDRGFHPPFSGDPVTYLSAGVASGSGRFVLGMKMRHRVATGQVVCNDHNPDNPRLSLSAKAPAWPGGARKASYHGENCLEPGEAARQAQVRAEEVLASRTGAEGWGVVPHLRSGHTFELEGHPRAALNAKFLVTSVEHSGWAVALPEGLTVPEERGRGARDVFHTEFSAIPASLQYRPPRRTPWPKVHGVIRGAVDGPVSSPYGQLDDRGRYKVRLRLDESALPDGQASTWIRRMQPHAGNPEGFHFPLRKGTEVLVSFLHGDPDQPVITGALPDDLHPSPIEQRNHTGNILQTGAFNRLKMQDQNGLQFTCLFSPFKTSFVHLGKPKQDSDPTSPPPRAGFHYVGSTEGNALIEDGGNFHTEVGGKKTEHVKGAVIEHYDKTQDITVGGEQKSTVTKGVTEEYGTQQTTTITSALKVKAAHVKEEFQDEESKTVTGAVVETFGDHHHKVDGKVTNRFGPQMEIIPGDVSLTYGASSGKWASLVWIIAGKGTITCPNLTLKAPPNTEVITVWDFLGSYANLALLVKITVAGIKTASSTFNVALGGAEGKVVGLATAAYAFKLDICRGDSSAKGGAKVEIHGIALMNNEFKSLTFGGLLEI